MFRITIKVVGVTEEVCPELIASVTSRGSEEARKDVGRQRSPTADDHTFSFTKWDLPLCLQLLLPLGLAPFFDTVPNMRTLLPTDPKSSHYNI